MSTTPLTPSSGLDLHLVFNWEWAEKEEKDVCLVTAYTYSEIDGTPEVRQSVNYYVGFERNPRSRSEAFGSNRNFDMNMDLSGVSAETAKKILGTPERLLQEIENKKAGKFDPAEQFQPYAFAPSITGINPIGFTREDAVVQNYGDFKQPKVIGSRSTASKNGRVTPLQQLYGDLNPSNPGVHVGSNRKALGRRKDAPWWILDDEKFRDFAHVLTADKGSIWVALDYTLLDEFYRLGYEDDAIFKEHRREFLEEKERQRQTKSVAAVKKRRQRLVQRGNEVYGQTRPNVIPISQPRPQARPIKRAFAGLAGRGA